MMIQSVRFGHLSISDQEVLRVPLGLFGFPELTKFCLVDPGDDTLILWLQSIENPSIAFPVLEPKIFKSDYIVRLSGAELRELKLDNVNQSAVFTVLTVPEDVTQMSANLKAPLVINLREQIFKQVVLQENEYGIKFSMFKELRAHLVTMNSQNKATAEPVVAPVAIRDIPPSLTVRSLQL